MLVIKPEKQQVSGAKKRCMLWDCKNQKKSVFGVQTSQLLDGAKFPKGCKCKETAQAKLQEFSWFFLKKIVNEVMDNFDIGNFDYAWIAIKLIIRQVTLHNPI